MNADRDEVMARIDVGRAEAHRGLLGPIVHSATDLLADMRAKVEGLRMEHTHDCNEDYRDKLAGDPYDRERLCICRAETNNAALNRVLAILDRRGT